MERSPLDTDTLEVLLRTLKDHEVTRFKWGDIEIEFDPPSAGNAAAGFLPPVIVTPPGEESPGPTERLVGYHKAFQGPPPSFVRPGSRTTGE